MHLGLYILSVYVYTQLILYCQTLLIESGLKKSVLDFEM